LKNIRHSYCLAVGPGFQTSVMALANFRAPSVQTWSLFENGKTEVLENRGRRREKTAGRVKI